MANPTTRFVSVNLNKSYGQHHHHHQPSRPSPPYANGGIGSRARPAPPSGRGMVVLSRARAGPSSVGQKGGAKLSVPAPLNLPSLRKEHERFDPAAAGSAPGAAGGALGPGHGPSAMGWSKPGDRPGSAELVTGNPSRPQPGTAPHSASAQPGERAVLLRGEDFPSLKATFLFSQKQKDSVGQRQRSEGRAERPSSEPALAMRPHGRSPGGTDLKELGNEEVPVRGRSGGGEKTRTLDGFLSGPLPVIQFKHTSDWADDERDTSHGILDRGRDRSFSRVDSGRGYDDYSDGRASRDLDAGNTSEKDYGRMDSFGRDAHTPGRNGNSWRSQMHSREGYGGGREGGLDRDGLGSRFSNYNRESIRDGVKYGNSMYVDSVGDVPRSGHVDQQHSWRTPGRGQTMSKTVDMYNGRRPEQIENGWHFDTSGGRYKGDTSQKNATSKLSSSKGALLDDPLLNLGRDSRNYNSNGKSSLDNVVFEGRDPFSGGLSAGDANSKLLRRKKDVSNQADFYDPVRESFEAELERVQKLQEEHRQRALQEHARVLALARKEEEERERMIQEEEERRRRLEEEARETAWRAEQDRLNAARRAEEQRLAREEEKKRILMEEERRKEAARQKLIELEAKIAKRQAEESVKDSWLPVPSDSAQVSDLKEHDAPKGVDAEYWEDGEQMFEHVTTSALDEPTPANKYTLAKVSILPASMEGKTPYVEQVKSWKNDARHAGNNSSIFQEEENESHIVKQDIFSSGRIHSRKGFSPAIHLRPSSKVGSSDFAHTSSDYNVTKGQKWNSFTEGDQYNQNRFGDSEFLDAGWDQNYQRGNPHVLYTEKTFHSTDADRFSSPGRSRYSVRQPRVLPPPTFSSAQRGFLGDPPKQSSSIFFETEIPYQAAERSEDDQTHEIEEHDHTYISSSHQVAPLGKKNDESASGCGLQSSILFSSPPISPTHLSHDEFDDSAEFPSLPTSADGKPISLLEGEHILADVGDAVLLLSSRSSPSREEWPSGNNAELQEQDEFDDGNYQEDQEPCEDIENIIDMGGGFALSSDMQNVGEEMEQEQKVLGFNDGVEVLIPPDDFEGSSLGIEKHIEIEMVLEDVALGLDSFDGAVGHESGPHADACCTEIQDTSELIDDTEKVLHDLVLDPPESKNYALDSSAMYSAAPVQTLVTSTFDLSKTCASGHPVPLPTSTSQDQPEAPVQLQFGLFSGPSLIPSPVPAIQIGSIHMPLNIHSTIGASHVLSTQPPFLQFGQLRYTSPISQGILPVGPQSIPYIQPSIPIHYSLTEKPAGSFNHSKTLDSSAINSKKEHRSPVPVSLATEKSSKLSYKEKHFDESSNKSEVNRQGVLNLNEHNIMPSENHSECSPSLEKNSTTGFDTLTKFQENRDNLLRSSNSFVHNKTEHIARPFSEGRSSQFLSGERSFNRSRTAGPSSAGRGKRLIYTVKNKGPQLQFSGIDNPRGDFGIERRMHKNVRRTEFRVRENGRKRIDASDAFYNYTSQEEKPYSSGSANVPFFRNGSKRDPPFNRSSKMPFATASPNTGSGNMQPTNLDGRRKTGKESTINTSAMMSHLQHEEGSKKGSGNMYEDVDAPLQSGVVRVYKQPGIEIPSDEDDFIEVRSKRQMLNDRREQREKEIKAKSRETKASRKPRSVSRTNVVLSKPSKVVRPDTSKNVPTSLSMELADLHSSGQSAAFSVNTTPQPLAPIGTPTVNADIDTLSPNKKALEMSSVSVVSSVAGAEQVPQSIFEKVACYQNVGSWTDTHVNQQVMSLTQTQLEEAMKPECFDTCGSLVVEHESMSKEQEIMSNSVVPQEKSFAASGNPLSSLLAGERIQFGAVTTPTFLPSVSRSITNGIRPLASATCKIEGSKERILASDNSHAIFFDKEKHRSDSCIRLEDPEAEAEAAASAVAVAAISSDDVVNTGLSTTSISISDHGKFGSVDGCVLTSQGVRSNGQATTLPTGEESLPVTLPADLSVETPLPLWPVLPTQNTSNTMFSQFPGHPPSHFPCFEMNPMLRAPIYAFGPQDDSSNSQSQPQRSTTLGTGPLGSWSHAAMDSFYGPPAGFTGHFISPPTGMPAVQATPQMLFYNHFPSIAPYGIMGTTFISSGKQPDWKHNPVSSAIGVNEGDNESNIVCSAQHAPPSMPPSLQHLSPASSLVPMPSPLPMFDMSSFQSTVDVPVQARWPTLPPTPLHAMPFSPLPRTQVDGGMSVDVSQRSANISSGNHKFPEVRPTTEAEIKLTFSTEPTKFPEDLGLVDRSSSIASRVSSCGPSYTNGSNDEDRGPNGAKSIPKSAGGSSSVSVGMVAGSSSGSGRSNNHGTVSASKSQIALQQNALTPHSVGYMDKRGASSSQKMGSGGEWHRRIGFQGRSHIMPGPERGFPPSKVKQIYVAKSSAGRTTTSG